MSTENEVVDLRNGLKHSITINNRTTNSKSGLSKMDMSFSFTPFCVPAINNIKLVEDEDGNITIPTTGTKTTYYFVVTATNFDMPCVSNIGKLLGLSTGDYKITRGDICAQHLYYDNKVYKDSEGQPVYDIGYSSNMKSIEVPNDGKTYRIDLYLNYAPFINNINVYCGTKETDEEGKDKIVLKLIYISALTQVLNTAIGTGTGREVAQIILDNNYPFPNTGIVKIDNEIINYKNCFYNKKINKWVLDIDDDNARNSVYKSGHDKDAVIYLLDRINKTRIPIKQYDYEQLNQNVLYYVNFNNNNSFETISREPATFIFKDSDKTSSGEDKEAVFGIFDKLYGYSYFINGDSLLEANTNVTKRLEGSVYFNFVFTDFNTSTNETNIDPYILYPKSGTGLYIRISRLNKKPYVGYIDSTSGKNYILFSDEDLRIPTLSSSKFDTICLSWSMKDSEYYTFSLRINKTTKIEVTNIIKAINDDSSATYISQDYYVGGKCEGTNSISSYPIGYLDNFRIIDLDVTNLEDTELVNGTDYTTSTSSSSITITFISKDEDDVTTPREIPTDVKIYYNNNEVIDYTKTNETTITLSNGQTNVDLLKVTVCNNNLEYNKLVKTNKQLPKVLSGRLPIYFIDLQACISDGEGKKTDEVIVHNYDTYSIYNSLYNYNYKVPDSYYTTGDYYTTKAALIEGVPNPNDRDVYYVDADEDTSSEKKRCYIYNASSTKSGSDKWEVAFEESATSATSEDCFLIYEQKFHTSIDCSHKSDVYRTDYNVYYDNWLMYEYIKQDADWYNEYQNGITYPIDPKTIQIRYDMKSTSTFTTPFLFSPSTIISEISIG